MITEASERREIPSSVLFHGTTLTRFNQFLRPDGSYEDPAGGKIWFDENSGFPLTWSRMYKDKHYDEGVLLIARSDILSLQKSPIAKPMPHQMIVPSFWTADKLPPKSFVHYNITKDELSLYGSGDMQRHLDKMRELCEPLGVLPDYVWLFSQK